MLRMVFSMLPVSLARLTWSEHLVELQPLLRVRLTHEFEYLADFNGHSYANREKSC